MTAPASRRPLWPTLIVVVGSLALVALFLWAWGNREAPTSGGVVATVAATPTASATSAPDPTATQGATDPELLVPVVVVDQSAEPGLGEQAAAAIEDGGWPVDSVEAASLGVPSTTLYVPPGLEESAVAFQQAFPAVGRQRPAFAGLATSTLTLVVVDTDGSAVVAAMEPAEPAALGRPGAGGVTR